MSQVTLKSLGDELAQLKEMVAALTNRIAEMEGEPAPEASAPAVAQPAAAVEQPVVREESISEEVLLVISAAIAAYLGKRPAIRQIRLLGSAAWAQQGRVSIQASHRIEVSR